MTGLHLLPLLAALVVVLAAGLADMFREGL